MAYVTETQLENAHGVDEVYALTGGSASTMASLIDEASARVREALMVGGYSAAVPETVYAVDASDCPLEIRTLAEKVWKRVAYARRDLSIPEDQISLLDAMLARVEEGRAEMKGLSRDVTRSPGGITSSISSPTSTDENARPRLFSRPRMRGF